MLQYPLRTGPTEELVWYVAEANALRRVQPEVSAADRARLIAETRRWVIRDLRGLAEATRGRAPVSAPNGRSTKPRGRNGTPDGGSLSRTPRAVWRIDDGVLE